MECWFCGRDGNPTTWGLHLCVLEVRRDEKKEKREGLEEGEGGGREGMEEGGRKVMQSVL